MSKICFIVGHGKSASGGYDSGAVSGGFHEFKIAREIAKYAQAYYNANYQEQCDLMNYDGDLYLTDRIKKVNANSYSMIAEFHLNAGGGTGPEVYYYHGDNYGRKYAAAISAAIAKQFGLRNRGAKVKLNGSGKDYFAIIRDTRPRAMLIETVFIDKAADLEKVKTAAGQKQCGETIAKALATARGVKKKEAAKPATPAVQYFKKYTGKSGSIVDALKSIGATSSFAYRGKIAKANGIKGYVGLPAQNTKMLSLLKQGKLIKP